MRILIVTAKDHPYATILMNALINAGIFYNDEIALIEQDAIIPKKRFWNAILCYIKTAGYYYFIAQSLKQYIFLLVSWIAQKQKKYDSFWYPYQKRRKINIQQCPFQTLTTPEAKEWIKKWNPECILSIFSREIIQKEIFTIPKYGTINIQPSILPTYRGVSPIFWALAEGALEAGVTIHKIDEGIDTGPYYAQEIFSLNGYKSEHEIYCEIVHRGSFLLKNILEKIKNGEELKILSKDENRISCYRSLPTQNAVRKFKENQYSFFFFNEFFAPKRRRQKIESGETILLTNMSEDDQPLFCTWLQNDELRKLIADPKTPTLDEQYAWFKRTQEASDRCMFSIVTRAQETLIGNAGFVDIQEKEKATLRMTIGNPKAQNKGYGTEAMKLLIEYAKKVLQIRTIELLVLPSNERAIHVYAKNGFTESGFRDHNGTTFLLMHLHLS